MAYLVSSYYRGALHIGEMRKFGGHQEVAAQEYFAKMVEEQGDARAYVVTDDAPPKMMKWKTKK
jgi:hypothetical protein